MKNLMNMAKRALAIILITGSLLFTASSAFACEEYYYNGPVVIADDGNSYIHSSCSDSVESRIGGIRKGEVLEYAGETKHFNPKNTPFPWYKVWYQGRIAWVSGKYTTLYW